MGFQAAKGSNHVSACFEQTDVPLGSQNSPCLAPSLGMCSKFRHRTQLSKQDTARTASFQDVFSGQAQGAVQAAKGALSNFGRQAPDLFQAGSSFLRLGGGGSGRGACARGWQVLSHGFGLTHKYSPSFRGAG